VQLQASVATGSSTQTVGSFCSSTDGQCCQDGVLVDPCGPVEFDFVAQAADGGAPPLMISVLGGALGENVSVTARLHTKAPIPMFVSGHDCTLTIDTSPGPTPDVWCTASMVPITGADVPELTIGPAIVHDLTTDDFTVGGDATCTANLGLDAVTGMVEGFCADFLSGSICNSCFCISV
jgi:hypothetical protein